MSRVLVVDDEAPIQRALVAKLRARGYETDVANIAENAPRLVAREAPDVVILDLRLPGMDAAEVVQALRGSTSVPIIVLSARGAERDKVAALDAGADDYVTKPFGMDELLARLRAAIRRHASAPGRAVIATPDFSVDLSHKRIVRNGAEVRLTPTEWGIVEVLVTNADKLVSQRQLLDYVWGPGFENAASNLRVHLAHIRRKLEPEQGEPRYFLTEAGMGYRFRTPEPTT